MQNMTPRFAKYAVAAAVLLFGIWFYFTPFFVVDRMKQAVDRNDPVAMSECIDFPAVKESVKMYLSAEMGKKMREQKPDNPFEALGYMLANSMIGTVVDAFVTPQNLALMMSGIIPDNNGNHGDGSPGATSGNDGLDRKLSYDGFNTFNVAIKRKSDAGGPIVLRFRRDGLFGWKMSAIRFPETGFSAGVGSDAKAESAGAVAPHVEQAPSQAPVEESRDVSGRLREFVNRHTAAGNAADLVTLLQMYGDRVDYYQSGYVDRNFIAKDKGAYYRRWPQVNCKVSSPVNIQPLPEPGRYAVEYDIVFRVDNPAKMKHVEGVATNQLYVQVDGNDIRIVKEIQMVHSRAR